MTRILINRDSIRYALEVDAAMAAVLGRRTGRSTALALRALASAIENPGTLVHLSDHHGTHLANVALLRMTQDIASKLGLEKLTFSMNGTVKSNFAEVLFDRT